MEKCFLSEDMNSILGGGATGDVEYLWHEAPVPPELTIAKVHGWLLCPRTGRVLIQDNAGTPNLPGGTPESWDHDLVDTLIREAFEESQVHVERSLVVYLGYQEVHQPGIDPFAQVRMVGVIDRFAPRAPDPDSDGRIYRRYMTSLELAPRVLGWGEPAERQAEAAAAIARGWGIWVDNPLPAGYVD